MVTDVPPASGPTVGVRPVMVGAPTYVNLVLADVPDVAAGFVTVTSSVLFAVPAGAVAVIDVALLIVKPVALVAPNLTCVTVSRLVPVMLTDVPPAAIPEVGERLVTVGGATKVNWSAA